MKNNNLHCEGKSLRKFRLASANPFSQKNGDVEEAQLQIQTQE